MLSPVMLNRMRNICLGRSYDPNAQHMICTKKIAATGSAEIFELVFLTLVTTKNNHGSGTCPGDGHISPPVQDLSARN